MTELQQVGTDELSILDQQVFRGLTCLSHGIVMLQGATSWNAHERGHITIPTPEGPLTIPLAYDEREAPYAVDENGQEQTNLLLSLSDEDECIACAWAHVPEGSPLRGVGVDLTGRYRFRERASGRDLSRLLLTEREIAWADQIDEDPLLAYAALFGAKEAAFKATAAPLRRWYDHHDEQLRFEVRHFVMEEPHLERGTGRNGAAQDAMDRMGIERIVVRHARVNDMAVVCAVALAGEQPAADVRRF